MFHAVAWRDLAGGGGAEVLVMGPDWEADIDGAISEGLGGLFGE